MVEPKLIVTSKVYGKGKVQIPSKVIRAADLTVKDGGEVKWVVMGPGTVMLKGVPSTLHQAAKYRSIGY